MNVDEIIGIAERVSRDWHGEQISIHLCVLSLQNKSGDIQGCIICGNLEQAQRLRKIYQEQDKSWISRIWVR